MIKVKHFMDAVEAEDGHRIWVEPFGLTRDLQAWCAVGHVMPKFGPSRQLWLWFQAHPDGYEFFRARYHEELAVGPYLPELHSLAKACAADNTITLLHQEDDVEENTAAALSDFLCELAAWHSPGT